MHAHNYRHSSMFAGMRVIVVGSSFSGMIRSILVIFTTLHDLIPAHVALVCAVAWLTCCAVLCCAVLCCAVLCCESNCQSFWASVFSAWPLWTCMTLELVCAGPFVASSALLISNLMPSLAGFHILYLHYWCRPCNIASWLVLQERSWLVRWLMLLLMSSTVPGQQPLCLSSYHSLVFTLFPSL